MAKVTINSQTVDNILIRWPRAPLQSGDFGQGATFAIQFESFAIFAEIATLQEAWWFLAISLFQIRHSCQISHFPPNLAKLAIFATIATLLWVTFGIQFESPALWRFFAIFAIACISGHKWNIVITTHVVCHVTISPKILNNWQIGGRFRMTFHCTSIKYYEGKHHFKCPNLTLKFQNFKFRLPVHSFETKKVRCVYPLSEMPFFYLNKVNLPPIRQFPSFFDF